MSSAQRRRARSNVEGGPIRIVERCKDLYDGMSRLDINEAYAASTVGTMYIQRQAGKGMQEGYNYSLFILRRRLRRREGAGSVVRKGRLQVGRGSAHNMPESASALWRIVSLTAAKTRRMFEVSVAWVKLQNCDVSVTIRKKQLV